MTIFMEYLGLGRGAAAKKLTADYQRTFAGDAGDHVLKDLAKVCYMTDDPAAYDQQGRVDPEGTHQNVGRQQVFRHIMVMLKLDDQTIEAQLQDMERREDVDYGD